MKIGIFGYSGSGKTALCELLIGKRIETFDPFKPAVSTIKITDPRLKKINELTDAAKLTAPEVIISDYKGEPKETGFGGHVLNSLTENDCIVFVIDCFSENKQPASDANSLFLELLFRDTERLQEILSRRQSKTEQGQPPDSNENAVIGKCIDWLEEEKPVRSLVETTEQEKTFINSLGLSTSKPFVILANGYLEKKDVKAICENLNCDCLNLDLSTGTNADLTGFWKMVLSSTGQITFYTAGEKETRAWFLKQGNTAVEAAGEIHSDLAKGFIRAEIISYEDFISHDGSFSACQNAQTLQVKTKDYVVQDGEIVNIRFSR